MTSEKGRLQLEYVDPDDLVPFDGNPRQISTTGLEKLQRSVTEFGFTNPILVQRDTNMIIAGHQRLKAARAEGLVEVPVIYLDFDDVMARAYNVADNRLAEEAEWDMGQLQDLLGELDGEGFDLALVGYAEEELEDLLQWEPDGSLDDVVEDEPPKPPEDPVTRPGDLWVLGPHRLLCGDATILSDVERLMDGNEADMVFTDPPYNVDYVGKTKDALTIENDKMDNDRFRAFLYDAFTNMFMSVKPGGAIYVCHAESEGLNFRTALMDAGWLTKQCLIWVKNTFVLGRQDYQWKHEPILYGWKPGAAHLWNGGRKQTTVWEFDKPLRNADHPTMKPVGIPARAIVNSTKPGHLVLDLFLGSGSTLMAAEQMNRTCYGMELDPRYCDVIVQRWERLTGNKAERLFGFD